MISTVVVCFNEAEKLQKCLKSATGFADELVVVDLDSSDASIEVANKFGAKVFHHQFVPFVELVRDYAIAKTSGDWVLVLDSDEEIGKNLKEKLKEVVKKQKFTAVNIPRKNIFFGKWIKHTNWWPDRHIRFFKKYNIKWSDKIHSYPKVTGQVLNLKASEEYALTHFGYDSIKQFIEKQNRYSF